MSEPEWWESPQKMGALLTSIIILSIGIVLLAGAIWVFKELVF